MINSKLVHDCRKQISYQDVENDVKAYHITNILDDEDEESLYEICEALYQDYTIRDTNYKAYIEDKMNARVLMELRKSALLPFTYQENAAKFFQTFDDCKTVEDIKRVRTAYIKTKHEDYRDYDWQYYYMMRLFLSDDGFNNFRFDFEDCYLDGDYEKQTTTDDYNVACFNAHMPENLWLTKWDYKKKKFVKPEYKIITE